jgi:hypothetical protein
MRRKHDANEEEFEGVAQRLRKERPQASALDLDRIKTAVMSRTKSSGGARAGARRLAIVGLTVGLLAATTGGVLAGQSGVHSSGNAAVAQYGGSCDSNNGNGTDNGNGNGNNTDNCNENSFNNVTESTTNSTTNTTTDVTNNYGGTTNVTNNYTTVSGTPSSGVLGSTTEKAATSSRHIKIHVNVPRGAKLARVTVKVDGKRVKTLKGKAASANVEVDDLPCSKGVTTVEVTVTLSDGKVVSARHKYHLCAS